MYILHPSIFLSSLCSSHPLSLPPASHPSHFFFLLSFSSSPPLWQRWTIIHCFQVVCFFSSSIFLFPFTSKLSQYMLFPVTLWYTHTCHVSHLPISLQLSTEGGGSRGGSFYKGPLYSCCLVNTSNSTCFKVAKFNCLPFMLLCTCSAFSFKVFGALAHVSAHLAGDKSPSRRGRGCSIMWQEFAGLGCWQFVYALNWERISCIH